MKKTFYACPECGCTDIEVEAWIHLNTQVITDDVETSDFWCPQCGKVNSESLVTVDEEKPYVGAEETGNARS